MAPFQTFPVLLFLGTIVQLGGAVMLIALFLMLRRFVLRRAYFTAWTAAWGAFALAICALVIRYILVPGISGVTLDDGGAPARSLYFVYQACKGLGLVYFLRGVIVYVSGRAAGIGATKRLWMVSTAFAFVSAIATRHGLNEMVVWQSVMAVPIFGYCAWAMLRLPAPRRTVGSRATGLSFATLGLLWLGYGGGFLLVITGGAGPVADRARWLIGFNSYFDLTLNVLLGYSMIRVLMEDAKREMDDAKAELRLTHDRLRRAALYDSLTESLNRRAFAEGVGLDMARATFGTVVIADIDNLKIANDRHGHAIGDQLIRRAADALRGGLRQYDKLYRWGGDEFLIVLPSARASDVIERLRAAIAAVDAVACGGAGRTVRLQVSLGAADYSSSEDLETAIERADAAMYSEKKRRKSEPEYSIAEHQAPLRVVR
ncbi:MAG TPA: GGDEF domain-containing protein [Gemmatimonadaceae bacterium]